MQTGYPRNRFEKHDFKPALHEACIPGNDLTVSLSAPRDQFMIGTVSKLKVNNLGNFQTSLLPPVFYHVKMSAMNEQISHPLNRLMSQLAPGQLVDSAWLQEQGISRSSIHAYVVKRRANGTPYRR